MELDDRIHAAEARLFGRGLSGPVTSRRGAVRDHTLRRMDDLFDALALTAAPVVARSVGGMFARWYVAVRPGRTASPVAIGEPAVARPGAVARMPLSLLTVPMLGEAVLRIPTPRPVYRMPLGQGLGTAAVAAAPDDRLDLLRLAARRTGNAILDQRVVNIATPVLQHDSCPCGAVGHLADPRCLRRPARRATAIRRAGDPTARRDRGCRDVPEPGSSLRTAGSSGSCDRGWHRICGWFVGVTGCAASCSPATWPHRRQPIRGPNVRLEQAPAAACPGSRGGGRRLAMPRQRMLAAISRAMAGAPWRGGTFPQAGPAQRGHPVRSPGTSGNGC
jgi:pimeloyl-ACP methyl ester carboxylesterase